MKRARGADNRPSAGRQFEILGNAAVEQQAFERVRGIGEFQRVADLVIALGIESAERERILAPIAGRDVRPAYRASSLPSFGTSLSPTPGEGRPILPARVKSRLQASASGEVSVEPSEERKMIVLRWSPSPMG